MQDIPVGISQSILSQLSRDLFPTTLTPLSAIVFLVVALALIFAGRYIVRVIAFVGVGLVFAAVGAAFGAVVLSVFGLVLGAILGFIIGGLLSLVLLPLSIGIAVGLIVYHITLAISGIYLLSLVIGVIFFIIGIALALRLLSLATAVFGAFLLFDVLAFYFHIPGLIALLVAIFFGALGFWVQGGFEHRTGAKFVGWSSTPPPAGAVRVSRSPAKSSASVSGTSSSGATYCAHCGTRIDSPTASFCPNCGASLH
jgi:zinc-ribbon domain